jgi:hypothetical protein
LLPFSQTDRICFVFGTYMSDSLRAGRSVDRIPAGARYYAPVQTDLENTRVIPGGKAAEMWRLRLPPSNAEVKEWVELYLYSPSVLSWQVTD